LPPTAVYQKNQQSEHDIRTAVCALCIEMARIDETFTQKELDFVLDILKKKYDLPAENAKALIDSADKALADSVDLWHFARFINENYSNDEKLEMIEILWQIVYMDGKMDEHEQYLMNKLSDRLRLTHPQLIEGKLKVLRLSKSEPH
jgi:uncharacterized tellurite resistance protein B-like protein